MTLPFTLARTSRSFNFTNPVKSCLPIICEKRSSNFCSFSCCTCDDSKLNWSSCGMSKTRFAANSVAAGVSFQLRVIVCALVVFTIPLIVARHALGVCCCHSIGNGCPELWPTSNMFFSAASAIGSKVCTSN